MITNLYSITSKMCYFFRSAPSGLLDELMNASYRHSGDVDALGASLDVDSAAVDLVMSSAFTDEQIKVKQ